MKRLIYVCLIIILTVNMVGCSGNTVVQVNDIEISKEEYKKTDSFLNLVGVFDKEKNSDKNHDSILSFIIDNEVVYQDAKKKDYKASKSEIDSMYEKLKSSLNNNDSYKEIGEEFLKSQAEKDIIIDKYKKDFIKDIVISDKEIKDYYNSHKEQFDIAEVRASQILISTLDKDNKAVNKEEKEKLKNKANNILQSINNGESFEELAKTNSDDKSSGKDGGDLGYFAKKDKNSQFTNVVFKLDNNKTSEVFETVYGYHIVKVTDKRKVTRTLEESKDEIKNNLLNEKYIEHVDSLYKDSKITIA